jgi:hypothetical protein
MIDRHTPLDAEARYAAGVLKYAQMGYWDPDYQPSDTDILALFRASSRDASEDTVDESLETRRHVAIATAGGGGAGFALGMRVMDLPRLRAGGGAGGHLLRGSPFPPGGCFASWSVARSWPRASRPGPAC